MNQPARIFTVPQLVERGLQWGDLVVLLAVMVLIYAGISLAVHTPRALRGPDISLAPEVLPYYAVLSVGRMAAAYLLSLFVALLYGRAAAQTRQAEQVLMPLLDVLQSVPILSFLPVVLLSFSAVLPPRIAAEFAAIVLIFTSQAWNLIFAWYQSLKTIPSELREASAIFQFNGWLRFRTLELPFAAISLIWNSMMSWAGGWFFLMAAEIFTVGERDFRLPGLGAYLQEAANRGDIAAIAWGLGALVSVIVVLDQLVWRPLLAWSNRFKLEMVAGAEAPSSWFYSVLRHSRLILASQHVVRRGLTHLDVALLKWFPAVGITDADDQATALEGVCHRTARWRSVTLWPLSSWVDAAPGVPCPMAGYRCGGRGDAAPGRCSAGHCARLDAALGGGHRHPTPPRRPGATAGTNCRLHPCHGPLSGGRARDRWAAGRDEPGRRAPHAHGHAVVSPV